MWSHNIKKFHMHYYAQNPAIITFTSMIMRDFSFFKWQTRGVSQFMGYIKSKSALMIFDRHANLKYKYGRRNFWARGYFVDTVGKNEKIIKEYIRNQLQEDYVSDQISIEEYIDPFTGEKKGK